jgi:hypothetical protein
MGKKTVFSKSGEAKNGPLQPICSRRFPSPTTSWRGNFVPKRCGRLHVLPGEGSDDSPDCLNTVAQGRSDRNVGLVHCVHGSDDMTSSRLQQFFHVYRDAVPALEQSVQPLWVASSPTAD